MILERMVLRDVGVYRGEHVIDLAPPSRRRPIIFFGGLEGGGKTTLVDALQLALYGGAAQCSNRGALGYEELLRRSIHRGVDPRDGAAIEIDLTHVVEGKPHAFRVRRSWSVQESHVREKLAVIHDGALDPVSTEAWPAQIEEMLPVRLAPLFFVDGEKIASLADPARSAEVLSTAIHVLLGLDVVDQLTRDLAALEWRKKTERQSAVDHQALEAARREAERLTERHQELVTARDAAQIALDRAARGPERARGVLRAVEADIDRTIREEGRRWGQYQRLLTKEVEEEDERHACGRILDCAARERETMARFRGAVLGRRVRRIEQLILEGFRHLLCKESLVSDLRIDPETFTITLVAADGRDLSPERLSAGERQILAVSTLWGLSRVSGRLLPVVIDAPRGWLDSTHRGRLLERYVPHASHQVILLSTDEEIDEASYALLEPSIGRAYTLRFDDLTASTTVEPVLSASDGEG